MAHCMSCENKTKTAESKVGVRKEWQTMNEVKFNINATCSVKLTTFGRKVVHEHEKFIAGHGGNPWTMPGYDRKTGILKTEFWTIMNLFGQSMVMGFNDMPFVNNEVRIESP